MRRGGPLTIRRDTIGAHMGQLENVVRDVIIRSGACRKRLGPHPGRSEESSAWIEFI